MNLSRILPMTLILAAGPALAQDDPIGALLDKAQAAPPPTEAPAPSVSAPAPTLPPPPAPYPPAAPAPIAPPPVAYRPYAPPPRPEPSARSTYGGPVQIDETGRTPDGPPTDSDRNYEARMRASFAASQGMQGALDGHWVVRAGSEEVYDVQLVDRQGELEGAWRDPRRRGAPNASGFIDEIQRNGGQLMMRFRPHPGADPATLTLQADSSGGWTGEMIERGDRRAVSLRRN